MVNKAESVPASPAPRHIAMLIYPGVTPLDVTGPLQVFDLANRIRRQDLYDIVTVAPTAGPVRTPLGFDMMPNSAMSKVAAMSERDFARKFRQETGQTRADYVTMARLEAACQALSETRLPLKAVARRCGFSSVAVMRRTFMTRVGVPPQQYRDNFRL
jgi:transcriptional regulator GlxA family with amidase domain